MKTLPISGTTLLALIDDEDLVLAQDSKWSLSTAGYVYATIKSENTSLHRLVMGFGPGDPMLDHRDRNPLNNQKYNLRVCSISESNANRGKPITNTSGYKGVFWRKDRRCWVARVMKHKKWHYVGSFTRIEDAARAYDRKAIDLFGEFACLNFPTDQAHPISGTAA